MIRPVRILPHAAAAVLLAACAAGTGGSSYVAPLQQPGDAEVLANAMAEFVAGRLPAAASTVAFAPTPAEQAGNAVTGAFASALRRRGFAVAEGGQPPPARAHRLRYLVTPMDNGNLVRLTIDDSTQGARFFARDPAGGLRSGGPYTVTQAENTP